MTIARAAAVAITAGAAACSSFESEDVVIDTRVIAMAASVPDQVVDIDFSDPPEATEVLAQLVPSEMCALVADPAHERRLRWKMTLCVLDSDQRCDSEARAVLASGIADDPELAVPPPRICATVMPDGNLLGVLLEAVEGDVLSGLGGIAYGIELVVGGEDVDPALDLFAGKRMTVAPRIPDARTANTNPTLARLEASIGDGEPVLLPMGRCVDQPAPYELPLGTRLRLHPVEPEGVRETYVVPRLDGQVQSFTEALTYQWLVSAGGLSEGSTGGPRDDVTGQPEPLFTDYSTPAAKDVVEPTNIEVWIVQRDERLGAAWFQTCVRVRP